MAFREKVRRAFSRANGSNKTPKLPPNFNGKINANGIPIEYYRRGEVPPSKFRGPFNREHQRNLAAWSFEGAMAERCRSLDLSLSPCTTLPPESIPPPAHNEINDDEFDESNPEETKESTGQLEPVASMFMSISLCMF